MAREELPIWLTIFSCFAGSLYGQSCITLPLQPSETAGQLFADFVHDTASQSSLPLTITTPAATAAFSQYVIKPAGYGSDAGAYAYHYSLSLLDSVNGKFVRDFGFPVLFRENPHYAPTIGNCTRTQRLLHVLRNEVLTEKGELNWSSLPASAALAGLSNAYVPDQQRTWSSTLIRFATNAGGRLAGDAFEEFCPDIKRGIPFLPCPSKLTVPVARKRDVFRR